MNKTLKDHFLNIQDRLIQFHKHTGIAQHGDVKGFAREGFIKYFLKNNLPPAIAYYTGEIIDKYDNRSGQIDVILQSVFSPKINLFEDINISLNDYVIGAIEVKSTLTNQHLLKSLETFKKVKKLHRDLNLSVDRKSANGTKYQLDMTSTPCFLFAYSGMKKDTLLGYLASENKEILPEIIVNLKENYTLIKNDGFLFDINSHTEEFLIYEKDICLLHLYQYINLLIEAWVCGLYNGECSIKEYLS